MSNDQSGPDIWATWAKSVRTLPVRFRLTRLPVIGKHLFRNSFVGDPTSKAWLVPVHEDIGVPDSVHLPLDVLRPLIEKSAYRARTLTCVCRAGFGCKDFPHDVACLFLGRAFIDAEQFGLEPLTVEQAIAHVEQAVGLGLVPTIIWEKEIETAFGAPQNTGLGVCLCCDCCCDYRLGLRVGSKAFRKKVFRPEGVSVIVSDACERCGTCAEPKVCSVRAVALGPTKAQIDLDKCVGCGHCILVCPNQAIHFQLDPTVDLVGKLLTQVEAVTDIT